MSSTTIIDGSCTESLRNTGGSVKSGTGDGAGVPVGLGVVTGRGLVTGVGVGVGVTVESSSLPSTTLAASPLKLPIVPSSLIVGLFVERTSTEPKLPINSITAPSGSPSITSLSIVTPSSATTLTEDCSTSSPTEVVPAKTRRKASLLLSLLSTIVPTLELSTVTALDAPATYSVPSTLVRSSPNSPSAAPSVTYTLPVNVDCSMITPAVFTTALRPVRAL